MKKIHGFNLPIPKPSIGPGFDYKAIGDGVSVLRWDRHECEETFTDEKGNVWAWHRLDCAVARYVDTNKATYKHGFYVDALSSAYSVSIKQGAFDVWRGSGYWDTIHVIYKTANGWTFNGQAYKTLLSAIRIAFNSPRTISAY